MSSQKFKSSICRLACNIILQGPSGKSSLKCSSQAKREDEASHDSLILSFSQQFDPRPYSCIVLKMILNKTIKPLSRAGVRAAFLVHTFLDLTSLYHQHSEHWTVSLVACFLCQSLDIVLALVKSIILG